MMSSAIIIIIIMLRKISSLYLILPLLLAWPRITSQLNLDYCHESLGLRDGRIPDDALSASSSYDVTNVGPQNARLHFDSGGGAWCPSEVVSQDTLDEEYIEIDLGSIHVLTGILSQGRFGNGRGQEYAEAYKIHYIRQGMTAFREYRDNFGRAILPANTNTYAVANNSLNPAIFADKIRLLPYSEHPRTVCMRLELIGCPFMEGVIAYSIPQGMVRGAMLELMDHTYDGQEDSMSGDLRDGLGQLVDGRYGQDNFKATGNGGIVKGYDWLGWKKKSNSNALNLMFNFDCVRTFHRVDIHTNNHFTKDIAIFSSAKVYFSNEEGKFGDDRVVDFSYMPDKAIENARNVSINLKEQHGQYIMLQLFFEAKWILISEVTFVSEPKAEELFDVPKKEDHDNVGNKELGMIMDDINQDDDIIDNNNNDITIEMSNVDDISLVNKDEDDDEAAVRPLEDAGVLIGVLVAFILLLSAGIGYLIYRSRINLNSKSSVPTHSLLSRKFTNRLLNSDGSAVRHVSLYTPYSVTTKSVRVDPATTTTAGATFTTTTTNTTTTTTTSTQETIYEEPTQLYAAHGFLSLNRKFSSNPAVSEDLTDEYAEPTMFPNHSNSFSENIYAQAIPPQPPQPLQPPPLPIRPPLSLPISHYSRPLSPKQPPTNSLLLSSPQSSCSASSASESSRTTLRGNSPPKYTTGSLLLLGRSRHNQLKRHPSAPDPLKPKYPNSEKVFKFASPTSTTTNTVTEGDEEVTETETETEAERQRRRRQDYLGCVPHSADLAKLYAQINKNDLGTISPKSANHSCSTSASIASVDILKVELKEIDRSNLEVIEKLGEGQFGEIHLCRLKKEQTLVAVKSLKGGCDQTTRSDFEHEARILTTLTDPNLVRVLGVSFDEDNDLYCMVCEYSELGDLYQFLQDHVAETTLSKSPSVPTLSYGCLIYLSTQIASGMKYLETLNFVHRDLATRNCLVSGGPGGLGIKISDFGMSREIYKNDYYKSQAGCLLPIRWMAWESVLMGKFTTKSDVWSFGVTLWEILTFAREQPFESLSDDKVIASLSSVYQHGEPLALLHAPFQCPREVRDLMTECWQREETERPSFREIHLFLQRKNLGYNPVTDYQVITKKCKQNNNVKQN